MGHAVTRSASGLKTIQGFHAHVYFTPQTKPVAAGLRERIGALFAVTLGRWHDAPVGPHSQPMYQIAFAPEEFAGLVPWLMLNREGLSILVHPETGNDYEDHAASSLWLGPPLPLNLDILKAARPE